MCVIWAAHSGLIVQHDTKIASLSMLEQLHTRALITCRTTSPMKVPVYIVSAYSTLPYYEFRDNGPSGFLVRYVLRPLLTI